MFLLQFVDLFFESHADLFGDLCALEQFCSHNLLLQKQARQGDAALPANFHTAENWL